MPNPPSIRIALIHATPLAVDPIDAAFDAQWPDAERVNLLDDSLSVDRARGSVSASRISFDDTVNDRGMPSARLRPLTSISRTSDPGNAEPIVFLISSAVVSPISIP